MKLTSYTILLVIFLIFSVQVAALGNCFAQDSFEVDDTYIEAKIILPDAKDSQHHTIHTADDVDWVKFYALADERYEIKAYNLIGDMDAYIELYESDGETLIVRKDNPADPSVDEALDWYCTVEGIYYVKIGHADPENWSEGAEYDLLIHDPSLFSLPGYLTGMVSSGGGKPIAGAIIKLAGSEDSGAGMSQGDGSYIASAKEGSYTVSVSAGGYQSSAKSGVTITGSNTISVNFVLNTPPVAIDDLAKTTRGGTATGNVLINDLDDDGDALTAVLETNVSHGTLSLQADGQFTYTHNGDTAKQDSFTYHASDGQASSSPVTVSIIIDMVPLNFLMLLMK